MKVPFLDLRVNDRKERKELLLAIDEVFTHGRIVLGPEVFKLESAVAKFCGRRFAIGVNSGTDALFLGLKSLNIGKGDEVITTALSWIATANAITLTGATPVFADITDDLNIDPRSVAGLITNRTKAILPVHYTGKVCDMRALLGLAKKNKLFLVEDASQAFGALYRNARAGSFGDLACFSMNPMKVFAACGEAGMIVTDDKASYERLIVLRYNGVVNKEKCLEPSLNGRLDTLQAAVLLKRFAHVPSIIQRRRKNAAHYDRLLAGIVRIPVVKAHERDVYYTYTIRAARRDELKAYLERKGVETKIQHPFLMPEQPGYPNSKGHYPHAKDLIKTVLCLPIHEKLKREQIEYVAAAIKHFYAGRC